MGRCEIVCRKYRQLKTPNKHHLSPLRRRQLWTTFLAFWFTGCGANFAPNTFTLLFSVSTFSFMSWSLFKNRYILICSCSFILYCWWVPCVVLRDGLSYLKSKNVWIPARKLGYVQPLPAPHSLAHFPLSVSASQLTITVSSFILRTRHPAPHLTTGCWSWACPGWDSGQWQPPRGCCCWW